MVNEALMCKNSDWLPFKCPTHSPTLSDGCIGDWLRERLMPYGSMKFLLHALPMEKKSFILYNEADSEVSTN